MSAPSASRSGALVEKPVRSVATAIPPHLAHLNAQPSRGGIRVAQADAGTMSDAAPSVGRVAVADALSKLPPPPAPKAVGTSAGVVAALMAREAPSRPVGGAASPPGAAGFPILAEAPARPANNDLMRAVENAKARAQAIKAARARIEQGASPAPAAPDVATVQGIFRKHGVELDREGAAKMAAQARDGDWLTAFAAGVGDGALFGFADNALAALRGYTSSERTYRDELQKARIAQDMLAEFNPGATLAGQVVGGVGSGVATGGVGAAARIGAAVTTAGKVGRAALGGAAAGGLYGAGDSNGENVAGNVASGAGFGAAGGVIGREAAIKAGRLLSRLIASPRFFDGSGLTEAGRGAMRARGIDPDVISDGFARNFARRIQEAGGASDEVVNMAIADEFGIPLTRGQATGDVPRIAFEEAARNSARGRLALEAVQAIDDQARRRTGEAVGDMARGFGGMDETALGAAERVSEGVRRARDAAKGAARESYAALDAASGGFSGRLVRDLDAALSSRLANALPPDAVNANGAIASLRRSLGSVGDEKAFTAGELERVRQMLGRYRSAAYRGANAADQEAMREIVGAFDGWVDDVFTAGLTDADPAVLELAKQSRELWRDYVQTFTRQKGDDASGLMAKMAEIDVTPQEAANWLWGASTVGAKGSSVRLARKLKDALPAEDWNAVRAGAWRRVAEAPAGREFGPKMLANRIRAFTEGEGGALAQELFTPDELAQMSRFAQAMDLLVPPPGATNPSKTAYGMARLAGDAWQNMASVLGFATGGVEAGLGAKLGGMAASGVRSGLAARSIPAPRPQRVPNPVAGARGVVGGGAAGAAAAPDLPGAPRPGLPFSGGL